MSAAPSSDRASRGLRLALALYPRRWRARFADEVRDLHHDLARDDPREARRLVRDLCANAPGVHLDQWRLGRARGGLPPKPLPERPETAEPSRPDLVAPDLVAPDLATPDPGPSRSFPAAAPRLPVRPRTRPEASVLDALARDFRFALRRFARVPTMTGLAVTTLALGIGGTTAMFSVVNGVLLEPLSAPAPERMVTIYEASESSPRIPLSYEGYLDYRDGLETLEHLALLRTQSVAVTGGGEAPERIRGMFVTHGFFEVVGEPPLLGRGIAEGEDGPGGERTAVLTHGFWQRRFGADEAVLGQTLDLNNEPHTIVGVMGPSFRFPYDSVEAYISLQTFPGPLNRENRTFFAIGRMAEGRQIDEVGEELEVLAANLAASYPDSHRGVSAGVEPVTTLFSGSRTRDLLSILVAAVAMVLSIGVANVANLQLAQATGRGREMVLRSAVGAGHGRLLAQLLVENLVLALVGGGLGIAVAYGGVRLLSAIGPGWLVGSYAIEPDPKVLLFALAVTILAGLAFGLVPARRAANVNLVEGLRDGGRGSGFGPRGGKLRSSLVVAQVAMAVVLVIGAGLLVRSIHHLGQVDVGFDTANLLTVQFRLAANDYETDEQVIAFFDQALEDVRAVPGVLDAASAIDMPFTGDGGRAPFLADGIDPGAEVEVPSLRVNLVSPGYFRVMGITRLEGRTFDDTDLADGLPVVVLSRQAAERLWPGRSPIGRTLAARGDETSYSVIGVVDDIYNRGIRNGYDPMAYFTYRQEPSRFATLAARTSTDPHALADAIRAAIWQSNPDQPLWEVMTQEERIAGWSGSDRFLTILVGLFSAIALLLAAVGIGGVMAYSVALRRRELGVRISLGATRRQIAQMVVLGGFRLVALGLVLGLVGAVALHRVLDSFLYGMSAVDLSVFVGGPLLLALVALVSILVPASRAASVDPLEALEDD